MVKAKKKAVKKAVKKVAIKREDAMKVLAVVDQGLTSGIGEREPGQMCVEAAVAYAMGETHRDNPKCVTPAIRDTKIGINDDSVWGMDIKSSHWGRLDVEETNKVRAKALRRLAIAQLGSKGVITDAQWTKALWEYINSKTGADKTVKAERAVAEKELLEALKELKAGHSIDTNVVWNEPDTNHDDYDIDVIDELNAGSDPVKAAKICEDLVKILIKLKSPGTKFLYLTTKEYQPMLKKFSEKYIGEHYAK